MSFLGNIAAAQTAKVIGKYNQSVLNQQAAYDRRKAEIQGEVYEKFDKPKFVDQQNAWMKDQFVETLRTGAEFREGETGYLVLLKNMQNQARQVSISDYNKEVERIDLVNQSLLLQARGRGESLKGEMTARAQLIGAGASLLTMGYASHSAGRLVIT